ncbi:unnamed protein product [Effrenium voratum]|nr:unnamed protein product [Effrenium voratum]
MLVERIGHRFGIRAGQGSEALGSEALETLCAFLDTLGATFDKPQWSGHSRLEEVFQKVQLLAEDKTESARIRCLLKEPNQLGRQWQAMGEELLSKLRHRVHNGEEVLLWISMGVDSWPIAVKAARYGVLPLVYSAEEQHSLEDIVKALTNAKVPHGSLQNVGWLSHDSEMTGEHKASNLDFLGALKPFLAEHARVDVLGCEMVGETGMQVIHELKIESGLNLAASTDLTAESGGNWLLEKDDRVNVKDLYFTEAIAEFSEVLLGYAMHRKMLRKVRGMK